MSKLKVGDKVKVVATEEELAEVYCDTTLIQEGKTYKVVETYSSGVQLLERGRATNVDEHMVVPVKEDIWKN